MAVYEQTLFGTEKYGPNPYVPAWPKFVDYEVDPVVAEPLGYTVMSLRWKSPVGAWTGLRVLKNYSGYAIHETDGEILLDTGGPSQSLLDGAVRPGAWHYYTIFVQSQGMWQRSGGAAALMIKDHGYGQRLFDHLPLHHQSVGLDGNDNPVENETLKKFLAVLGWGMDGIKTNFDSLQSLNDPSANHLSDLARLSNELGITYEASAPAHLFRKRVRNAAILGREKGTLEQLQSLIALTTSYTVDLSFSPNVMVNDDAAEFAHPIYKLYDVAANYLVTERVRFNNYVYQCNIGGAYGLAQAPTGAATSNTWWTVLTNTTDATLVDVDGAISGWEPTYFTGATKPTLALALGVQSFQSATDFTSNALKMTNTTGVTADLGARSVAKRLGEATMDQGQILRFGAPIPVPYTYSATSTYPRGTLVYASGRTYRSLVNVTGVAPSGGLVDDAFWEIIGLDDRVNLTFSMHAKAGTGFEIAGYPVIDFWNERGALVTTLDTEKESATGSLFDSFGNRYGALSARTFDVGTATWTVQSGTWTVSDRNSGVAWPTALGLITFPGTADGSISATFDTAASGANRQFVSFRGATATSFLKATRTALYSSAAGVDTLIGTYSTPFLDQDRVTVTFVGTAITVSRNGVSVLATTSTVNQTATLHGLGVA